MGLIVVMLMVMLNSGSESGGSGLGVALFFATLIAGLAFLAHQAEEQRV